MTHDDIPDAQRVWHAAKLDMQRSAGEAAEAPTANQIRRGQEEYRYLLEIDPQGSFVALDSNEIVGAALSHVREGRYVLAIYGVLPTFQGRGIGRALLDVATRHGMQADRGLIFSSPDPVAMHRYISAGFELHPAMKATARPVGTTRSSMRRSDVSPSNLRILASIDRERGSDRAEDVRFMLDQGDELWIDDNGAYAVTSDHRCELLVALDHSLAKAALVLSRVNHCDLRDS